MKGWAPWAAAGLATALFLSGCVQDRAPASGIDRPRVVAAFYPLAFAAEAVGGGEVAVESLTPPGVEPHDLELSADQVRSLADADLVILVGGGFQPAVDDVVSGLEGTTVLDVRGPSASDPHVWLDPSIMDRVVAQVAARLSEIDPGNRRTYETNAATLQARLRDLDRDFEEGLSRCRTRDIVTTHNAFGYLADRYRLNQVSISGIEPEGEPSPGRLADVARFVEEHDVTTIFFEELASPDVAETLAAETGTDTAVLSPLESEPSSGDYVEVMQRNLAELEKALDCD